MEPEQTESGGDQPALFQYPLRAYGLWNEDDLNELLARLRLSVPSAGLWAMELPEAAVRSFSHSHFQYPLRAYGLWNA